MLGGVSSLWTETTGTSKGQGRPSKYGDRGQTARENSWTSNLEIVSISSLPAHLVFITPVSLSSDQANLFHSSYLFLLLTPFLHRLFSLYSNTTLPMHYISELFTRRLTASGQIRLSLTAAKSAAWGRRQSSHGGLVKSKQQGDKDWSCQRTIIF